MNKQSHTDSADDASVDYVRLLVTHLNFNKTPDGLRLAYEHATQEGESSTARLFLDSGGFSAWFAYFLAKRAANNSDHFHGQAAFRERLQSIEEISPERRKLMARDVRNAIPPDVRAKFDSIWDTKIQPQAPTVAALKRRRTDNDGFMPSHIPLGDDTIQPNDQKSSHFSLCYPPMSRVTCVFPTFLAGAVRKLEVPQDSGAWAARITMSFLKASVFDGKIGSMMSLEVTSNKVERLASRLFNVQIESTDHLRYLVTDTGFRIIPSPDFILRGCKRDVLSELFGPDINNGIRASPVFRGEVQKANPLTECVSMTITNRAADGAFVNLSLDEKEGVRIKEKLYG